MIKFRHIWPLRKHKTRPGQRGLFRHVKVRNKLVFLLTMFLGTYALLTAGFLYILDKVKVGSAIYHDIKNYQDATERIALLKADLNEVLALMLTLLDESDKDAIKQMGAEVKEVGDAIDAAFGDILATVPHQDIRTAILDAQSVWQEYTKTRDEEVLPALLAGNKGKAEALTNGMQSMRHERLIDQVGVAVDTIKLRTDELETGVKQEAREA
jgi:hypothetical protein